MGRIYCEACGANWRSSGDGPEAQEHHVDVPCVGESTEFKQRAEIAALTERLRIVEAERNEWKRKYETQCAGSMSAHERRIHLEADLSALREDLARKDAALKAKEPPCKA